MRVGTRCACVTLAIVLGVRFRAFAGLSVVALAGACARPRPVRSLPAATLLAKAPRGPVYRFVSLGVTNPTAQQALEGGRIGVLSDDGLSREVVGADGSIEQVSQRASESLMGGVPVPARFGGGFLFWSSGALYRAHSFGGALEPVTSLPTNAIGVEFGPNYLLVYQEDSAPRAFSLDPAGPLPLSPHGLIDVAATDDGRALALDAVGRAFTSTDAGKHWQDVTSTVGAVFGVRSEGSEVSFIVGTKDRRAWLERDGRIERVPLDLKFPQRLIAEITPALPKPEEALLNAVSAGLELPDGRALAAARQGLSSVDLHSGSARTTAPIGSPNATCVPISLEDEGIAACIAYLPAGLTTTIISHVLSAAPQTEKNFVGPAIQVLRGRTLNVIASCSGAASEGVACVRAADGAWTEARLSPELLEHWEPLYWVPRELGGVAVISSERVTHGSPTHLALLDPQTGQATWDVAPEQVNANDPGAQFRAKFQQFADGSVRGFTQTGSLAADPQGHVSWGEHRFTSVTNAGAHALARDANEHLWQTNDWGAHWQEIARPPFDALPEGVSVKENPRPSGRSSSIRCSDVGCVLEHSSTVGTWLRLGWPNDRPPALPTTPRLNESAAALPAPPQSSTPALPTLRCVPKSAGARGASSAAKTATAPARSASTPFYDVFSVGEDYVHYRLRATVDLASDERAPRALRAAQKTRFSARFTEPFEPQARARQLSGSLGGAFDEFQGVARPLLSSAPGHAAGVLMRDERLSFGLLNDGKSTQLPAGCAPESGYLDPLGKLLIACLEWSGATRIVEALSGRVRARLPVAARFHDTSLPGMHFFPPAARVFVNPDAIAVGVDGKPRILRLPPGIEPPTQDSPAWLLGDDIAPIELAPWSTLELASSPACAHSGGYRAIVQTDPSWLNLDDSSDRANSALSAIVRWSAERVCLEAIEIDASKRAPDPEQRAAASLVARFIGSEPGAAFVSTENAAARTPATCELVPSGNLSR